MKRFVSLIAVLMAMVSCISDPLPEATIPSVTLGENGKGYRDNGTGEEGELMRTSVRLYGIIDVKKVSAFDERGFYVGESIEEVQNGTASVYSVSTNDESFSRDLTDLEIDHTYYFCAFLKDGNKIVKSHINSFHTKAEGFALVNGLSFKDNTITARVSDDGGCKVTKVGFCFSLKDNPDIFDTVIQAKMNSDGTFNASLPVLEPASVYHIRAFADNGINVNRISYSDDFIIETPAEKDILVVAEHRYQVPQEGGEISVRVSHNYPLDVDINVDWIQLVRTKATYDEDFCFLISPNSGEENREGKITFYSKDRSVSQEILVNQVQKDAIILSETEKVLESGAGTFEIEVRHNVDFSVDLGGCSWIHRVDTRAMTTSTLKFAVDENTGVENRSAQITVKNSETGLVEIVTVTQLQKDALVVAKDCYTVDNDGGDITIDVGHNVDFTVDISDGWITQVGTKAYVNDKLVFNVARNSGDDSREGTITFTSKDGKITQTVKIYQSQTNSIIVSETEKVLESGAGTFEIEVRHNVDFSVDLGGCSWIHRVDTRAMTTSTLKFAVDENTGVENRSAQITVKNSETGLVEIVTVTQLQKDALVVAKDSYAVHSEGGNISVLLGHNVDFDINISDDWITQVTTKSYTEDMLTFYVSENTDIGQRTGTISFVSKDYSLRQAVSIVQEGRAFNIDIPDANFKAYCVANFDINGDGEISNNEANSIKGIDIRTENIISLKGIEYFTELETLICTPSYHHYISYSASGDYNIYDINNNPVRGSITELDVSNNINLSWLDCRGNDISSLDISKNIRLSYINVCYNKELKSLIFPNNQNIKYIEIGSTKVSSLNLGVYANLEQFSCFNCGITDLDISNNLELVSLYCSGNEIYSLNVSENLKLVSLSCDGCNLSSLDLGNQSALQSLSCGNNGLSTLDISNLTSLTSLSCDSNNLATLDVSNNTALFYLSCYSNNLTTIDVSRLANLETLWCNNNQINSLDVSNNLNMSSLWTYGNPNLTAIWLKEGQVIENFSYDTGTTTIYYK